MGGCFTQLPSAERELDPALSQPDPTRPRYPSIPFLDRADLTLLCFRKTNKSLSLLALQLNDRRRCRLSGPYSVFPHSSLHFPSFLHFAHQAAGPLCAGNGQRQVYVCELPDASTNRNPRATDAPAVPNKLPQTHPALPPM